MQVNDPLGLGCKVRQFGSERIYESRLGSRCRIGERSQCHRAQPGGAGLQEMATSQQLKIFLECMHESVNYLLVSASSRFIKTLLTTVQTARSTMFVFPGAAPAKDVAISVARAGSAWYRFCSCS